MNSLIPTPDILPVARGIFEFLLLLTFPLHLLVMNSLIGSLLIAGWAQWRGGDAGQRLAYRLAQIIPLLIAFTINLGVPPLLFVQVLYGHMIYSSSVLMGIFWIGVIPILLILYYGAYFYDFRFWSLGRRGLPVLFSVLMLGLAVAFIFSNNMTLMLTPEVWPHYFNSDNGNFLHLGEVSLLPRYLHMMVGASAVGGLAVAFLSGLWRNEDPEMVDCASSYGLRLFIAATLVQIVVGSWFLLSLRADVLSLFFGQHPMATAFFVAALLLVVVALHSALNRRVGATFASVVVLLYLMSFLRAYVRDGYLIRTFVELSTASVPDYSPLWLFVGTLLVGLVLVAWMVRVAFCCKE
ncbi:MAG: hypothetical protein JXR59_07665 [Desulfuromonadaceae bacterium]|nr:hypothetical protein [Desulfuromonadaceae bacterium]